MDIINIIHEPAICTTSFGYLLASPEEPHIIIVHRNPFLPLSLLPFPAIKQTHSFEDIIIILFQKNTPPSPQNIQQGRKET